MSIDFSVTIESLALAMRVEEAKARVAAHNIAMASRPGSNALQLDSSSSKSALQAARQEPEAFLQALGTGGMAGVASHVRSRDSNPEIFIDSEVADMSMASGRYQTLADAVSRQFALMQLAIRGGK